MNPVPGTKGHKNTVFVVRYGEEDLAGAKSLVDQCPADDPDTEMNLACLLAKEGRLQVPWQLSLFYGILLYSFYFYSKIPEGAGAVQ